MLHSTHLPSTPICVPGGGQFQGRLSAWLSLAPSSCLLHAETFLNLFVQAFDIVQENSTFDAGPGVEPAGIGVECDKEEGVKASEDA
jgi:hypothetical protein